MFARSRILALLTLLVTALWLVRPVALGSTWSVDDRMSQAGEIGTLPARRSEGATLERDSDDRGPAHPLIPVELSHRSHDDVGQAAPRPSPRRTVDREIEWFGASNSRGPPLLL
jgi:hypothetical protein